LATAATAIDKQTNNSVQRSYLRECPRAGRYRATLILRTTYTGRKRDLSSASRLDRTSLTGPASTDTCKKRKPQGWGIFCDQLFKSNIKLECVLYYDGSSCQENKTIQVDILAIPIRPFLAVAYFHFRIISVQSQFSGLCCIVGAHVT